LVVCRTFWIGKRRADEPAFRQPIPQRASNCFARAFSDSPAFSGAAAKFF
jgi:hypothetical protein